LFRAEKPFWLVEREASVSRSRSPPPPALSTRSSATSGGDQALSTPKKPGTDLAALKARLAKKTAGATDDVPPPGQVAAPEVPPPGQVAAPEIPPPGRVQAPARADVPPPGYVPPPVMHDVPAPGQVHHAIPDVPPPGMQMQAPAPAMQASQAPSGYSAGASYGGFDPDAGVIDSGPEIKPRGSGGLVALAAVGALALGVAVGWIGNTITSKKERIEQGRAKGEKMVSQVSSVSEARKSVSLAMEDLKKEIAENPTAAADKVTGLLTGDLEKQPQMSEMFGWQLASVDPAGIKATFQLYQQLSDLRGNLSVLANFLTTYGSIMKVGGPSLFGVTFTGDGAKMVVINKGLCGEAADKPDTLKPCDDLDRAVAFEVQEFGSEPKVMARGLGENQALLLVPEGSVYQYAVGLEPSKNAANLYKVMIGRIDQNLADMNGAEEKALKSLSKYADDPNVDGSQSADGG
jgi:hypothetical protein